MSAGSRYCSVNTFEEGDKLSMLPFVQCESLNVGLNISVQSGL